MDSDADGTSVAFVQWIAFNFIVIRVKKFF